MIVAESDSNGNKWFQTFAVYYGQQDNKEQSMTSGIHSFFKYIVQEVDSYRNWLQHP